MAAGLKTPSKIPSKAKASTSSTTPRSTRATRGKKVEEDNKEQEQDDSDSSSSSDDDSDDDAVTSAINLAASAIKKKWSTPKPPSNELTNLVPGYTAPMKLSSSLATGSSDLYINYTPYNPKIKNDKSKRGKAKQTAQCATPAATFDLLNPAANKTHFKQQEIGGALNKACASNPGGSSLMSDAKQIVDNTAGKGWFSFQSSLDPSTSHSQSDASETLMKDLQVIKNRNYLDPKKFYKSSDKFGKHLQVGTVIEGTGEYFSSRLTKVERRKTILDEVMADRGTRKYANRKFSEVQKVKISGGKDYYKKLKEKRVAKGNSRPFEKVKKVFK